jgi:uncharacterized protein
MPGPRHDSRGTQPAGGPFAGRCTWVLRKVGIDRMVFGGDYPLDDPGHAIETVKSLGFGDAELEAIMHDNAAAQLG